VDVIAPILLSLKVAALATVLSFLVGMGVARLFAAHRIPLRRVWEALLILPLVFPPTITGYLLLVVFGRKGLLGGALSQAGIPVVFTWAAAVIASFVVSLPLLYQNCKAALRSVEPQYARAARTLGVSEGRIFRRITLPLAAPGILAGIALSFARALGEFGATLMVAGNIPGRTQTIPLALYSAVEGGHSTEANVLLGVTVVVSLGLVAVVGWSERRLFFPGKEER